MPPSIDAQSPRRSFRIWLLIGGLSGLLLIGWWGWGKLSQWAFPGMHTHAGQPVEDHAHTHSGPFSHDHHHVGLPDGTTHSHPHQHRHQHAANLDLETQGWQQVGHLHGSQSIDFYARCYLDNEQLFLEFCDGAGEPLERAAGPPRNLMGELCLGNRVLEPIRFDSDDSRLRGEIEPSQLQHPTLSVVFSGVKLGEERFDFALPVDPDSQAE